MTNPTVQNQLKVEVTDLERQIDTVIAETIALVDTIDAVIQNITGQSLPQFLDQVSNSKQSQEQLRDE